MEHSVEGNAAPQKKSVPLHLSQWKAKRNQQAIERFMPGAMIFLGPTHAGDAWLFTHCQQLLKVYPICRLNLSHFCFVREHVGRAGVGIESGREEFQEEDETARPEIEGQLEGRYEAGSKAIGGAASHRGSDDFLTSCMVC